MTLHNAHRESPLPKVIHATQPPSLTEAEYKALRTYGDLNDADIESGECFYYANHAQTQKSEGDDFESKRLTSDGATHYATARRTATNQLVQSQSGLLEHVHNKNVGVKIYWLDGNSPSEVVLIDVKLI